MKMALSFGFIGNRSKDPYQNLENRSKFFRTIPKEASTWQGESKVHPRGRIFALHSSHTQHTHYTARTPHTADADHGGRRRPLRRPSKASDALDKFYVQIELNKFMPSFNIPTSNGVCMAEERGFDRLWCRYLCLAQREHDHDRRCRLRLRPACHYSCLSFLIE